MATPTNNVVNYAFVDDVGDILTPTSDVLHTTLGKIDNTYKENNGYIRHMVNMPIYGDAFYNFRAELTADSPDAKIVTVAFEVNGNTMQQYSPEKWAIKPSVIKSNDTYLINYDLDFFFNKRENAIMSRNFPYGQRYIYLITTPNVTLKMYRTDILMDREVVNYIVSNVAYKDITLHKEKPVKSLPILPLDGRRSQYDSSSRYGNILALSKSKINGFRAKGYGLHCSVPFNTVVKGISFKHSSDMDEAPIISIDSLTLLKYMLDANTFWVDDNGNSDILLNKVYMNLDLIDKKQDLSIFTLIYKEYNTVLVADGSSVLLFCN
jgi:hypothetical protein